MRSSNWTPSIVPSSDDQDACLVVDDFGRRGRAYCETDVEATDLETVIHDLLDGQYSTPSASSASTPPKAGRATSRPTSPRNSAGAASSRCARSLRSSRAFRAVRIRPPAADASPGLGAYFAPPILLLTSRRALERGPGGSGVQVAGPRQADGAERAPPTRRTNLRRAWAVPKSKSAAAADFKSPTIWDLLPPSGPRRACVALPSSFALLQSQSQRPLKARVADTNAVARAITRPAPRGDDMIDGDEIEPASD
jgi:hypothetical protein